MTRPKHQSKLTAEEYGAIQSEKGKKGRAASPWGKWNHCPTKRAAMSRMRYKSK